MELPEEVLRMIEWPNTPRRERLERAIELYARTREFEGGYVQMAVMGQETGHPVEQAIRDLPEMTLIMEDATWQDWCRKTMSEELAPDAGTQEAIEMISKIATCADDEQATGLAIMAWKPRKGRRQDPAMIHFGRMSRNPEWAGACPQLAHADGLTGVIIRSPDYHHKVGAAVCIPPLHAPKPADHDSPTDGERLLMDILGWHGAGPFVRYSMDEGFSNLTG